MRVPKIIIVCVLLSLLIRGFLLYGATELTYDSYDQLVISKQLKETGLPIVYRELSWVVTKTIPRPLTGYLIAVLSFFVDYKLASLIIINLAASLIPVVVYLLASKVTSKKQIINLITLLSLFLPLTYNTSLLSVNPDIIGIPLLLLTYYYFIRSEKTAKIQNQLIISVFLLSLTSNLSNILVLSMLLTIVLIPNKSEAMREVTFFCVFFVVWAELIITTTATINISDWKVLLNPNVLTYLGSLTMLAGSYTAYKHLTTQTSNAVHAMLSLILSVMLFALLNLIEYEIALYLISILFLILSAGAIDVYIRMMMRSRIKIVYSFLTIIIGLLFVITSALPSIVLGFLAYDDVITPDDSQIITGIINNVPEGETIYWNKKTGFIMEYYGYKPAIINKRLHNIPQSQVEKELIKAINSPNIIDLIKTLNDYNINYLVSENEISAQCFEQLNEVLYKIKCVVN